MSLYFGFLMVLNVAISLVHLLHLTPEFRMGLKGGIEREYSYIGDDFPSRHPLLEFSAASFTLQETAHYGHNATDATDAIEWETLNDYPGGYGRAHLGPNQRSFLMTFYHQSHCIRELQKALVHQDHAAGTEHHVDHCLQYLRQTFLCEAVDSVEKGDFMKKNYLVDRVQDEMVCWDWEAVFHQLDESWGVFTEWRKHWN